MRCRNRRCAEVLALDNSWFCASCWFMMKTGFNVGATVATAIGLLIKWL